MRNIDKTVADEVVMQLKSKKLIPNDLNDLEVKIATGTIKENEWKLIFEQQIRTIEPKSENETK